ncbi:hypothetical protein CDD83_2571 [Cordyceps sp. RAO-2017]|nr:hypothetical protein CDD83_2571 [Cordyceps sp. RAO-2017]
MENALDQTTLATVSLLESRLLRLEHILHGPSASPAAAQHGSVVRRLGDLERRFALILSRVRVYGDLLKIYKSHPDLFHAPAPSEPPSQLSTEVIRSIVLASASSYPATLSSLTAIKDCPIPDTSESTGLISAADRMKALHATQLAQAAEMAELRRRSEILVRSWYQYRLLASSQFIADAQGRMEEVERRVRRRERAKEEEEEF